MKHFDRRNRLRLSLGLIFVVSALAPSAAAADPTIERLDPVLVERAEQLSGRSRVIVEFHDNPDVRVFVRGGAGRRVSDRAQAGEVDNYALATLATDPRVARIVADRPAFPTMERTGGAVGARLVRSELGLTGKGIGVAIIDSGITSSHDDLYWDGTSRQERVAHFKDFTGAASSGLWNTQAYDDYGHGTHVAGVIAGNGFDSGGARAGIAPGAHLIGLKVLDANGHGYISDVIAAIDYAISIRAAYNIRVINLSVAAAVVDSYNYDPLTLAARRATQAGIVVVAAAGNLGQGADGREQYGAITAPGNAPWVLTVGAASHQGTVRRSDDAVAAFSSRGPTWIDFAAKPDLLAPGVGIESLSDPQTTLYHAFPDSLIDGTVAGAYKPYLSLSGTSMAAPVVAGTVALMLEANPSLTPNAVKAILQFTAQAYTGESMLAQGAGMLNARGAVRMARFFATPQRTLGPMADLVDGEIIPWARHVLWGNYRLTGGMPLPGSSAWAGAVTWGSLQGPGGQPLTWGVQLGDNTTWSTGHARNIVWSTAGSRNIVWSTAGSENIVWSTAGLRNIVWSTHGSRNIVWSTGASAENVVWGNDCGGHDCPYTVWGAREGDQVWGTAQGHENIVWSTASARNIVWSTAGSRNIVWSTHARKNIVWSTARAANIVWSTHAGKNIVWSTGTAVPVVWPASLR